MDSEPLHERTHINAGELVPLTKEQIAGLTLETELLHDGDPLEATKAIFVRALAAAAQTIVNAAVFSDDEKTRVAASRYIIDRVIGKEAPTAEGKDSPMEKLINAVARETAANQRASFSPVIKMNPEKLL